jgi:hypothetical protein
MALPIRFQPAALYDLAEPCAGAHRPDRANPLPGVKTGDRLPVLGKAAGCCQPRASDGATAKQKALDAQQRRRLRAAIPTATEDGDPAGDQSSSGHFCRRCEYPIRNTTLGEAGSRGEEYVECPVCHSKTLRPLGPNPAGNRP